VNSWDRTNINADSQAKLPEAPVSENRHKPRKYDIPKNAYIAVLSEVFLD